MKAVVGQARRSTSTVPVRIAAGAEPPPSLRRVVGAKVRIDGERRRPRIGSYGTRTIPMAPRLQMVAPVRAGRAVPVLRAPSRNSDAFRGNARQQGAWDVRNASHPTMIWKQIWTAPRPTVSILPWKIGPAVRAEPHRRHELRPVARPTGEPLRRRHPSSRAARDVRSWSADRAPAGVARVALSDDHTITDRWMWRHCVDPPPRKPATSPRVPGL